jgi:hypothetical protein
MGHGAPSRPKIASAGCRAKYVRRTWKRASKEWPVALLLDPKECISVEELRYWTVRLYKRECARKDYEEAIRLHDILQDFSRELNRMESAGLIEFIDFPRQLSD